MGPDVEHRSRHRSFTAVSLSSMRRAAKRKLESLHMPPCRDVVEFAQALSAKRGIPLHVLPVTIRPSDPCGLWLSTPEADFITYEAVASRPHQHHIIAHELGHMIYGHQGVSAASSITTQLLFPDLDPSLVQDMLGRSGYTEPQEQEAEMMATIIQDRLRHEPDVEVADPASADGVLDRIRRSLT
jgi:hypothetical protein